MQLKYRPSHGHGFSKNPLAIVGRLRSAYEFFVKEGVKNLHKNIQRYVSMVSWVP